MRIVTDASGNVIKTLDYDSFGNIIQDTNHGFYMPFGFAAGLYDQDTGLVRFGFREYSPEIGRWTAKDPILFLGAIDLYSYCLDDPINFIDFIGLDDTPDTSGGYWQYSQSVGSIAFVDANGSVTYYGQGYAGGYGDFGRGVGVNDPDMQSITSFGPIPRGWWQIGPAYGNIKMKLTPAVGTDTFGRTLFRIHGDKPCGCHNASEGCIILDRNIRTIISNSGYHFLKVIR